MGLKRKSVSTQETYKEVLAHYLRQKGLTIHESDKLLVGKPDELEHEIGDHIRGMFEQGKKYSTQNKLYCTLKTFYDANKVRLDWTWIAMRMEKQPDEGSVQYRAYTRKEMESMVEHGNLQANASMGIMWSGGPRIAPLSDIRIGHMKYIEKHGVYCIKIYVYEDNEEWDLIKSDYYTFASPQVSSEFLDKLVGKRGRNEFLFTNEKDGKSQVTPDGLSKRILVLAREVGIRDIGDDPFERKDVQLDHGFRKFFDTECEIAGLKPAFRKFMMGHKKGTGDKQDRIYFQPPVMELLEGSQYSPGYVVAIPRLTLEL